jgi:predicted dehydrogenase
VGCGLFGEIHLKAYTECPRAECVAIYDLNEELAARRAEAYGSTVAHSLDEIAEDDAIEAVSIATPDFAHTETALRLLEAGKHLLIEKPLATSSDEARQIIAAAKDAGRTVMVDFHNRWNPAFLAIKEKVDAGETGDPVMAYARLSNPLSIPFGMLSWSSRSGPQWFLMPHTVDIVRWLAGSPQAVSVAAHGSKGVLRERGADTWDALQALVQFENCFATIETAWILPESWPNLIDFRVNFVGTKSTCQMVATHQGVTLATPEGFRTPFTAGMADAHGRPLGFMVMPVYHFVDCILDGETPLATAEDGLATTQIIEAAVRSAEEGRTVEIDEI